MSDFFVLLLFFSMDVSNENINVKESNIYIWRSENPSHYMFFSVFQAPCEYSLIHYIALSCKHSLNFFEMKEMEIDC